MPTILAALGYAALTLLLTYPVSVAPATRALGIDADANPFLWTLGWEACASSTRTAPAACTRSVNPATKT